MKSEPQHTDKEGNGLVAVAITHADEVLSRRSPELRMRILKLLEAAEGLDSGGETIRTMAPLFDEEECLQVLVPAVAVDTLIERCAAQGLLAERLDTSVTINETDTTDIPERPGTSKRGGHPLDSDDSTPCRKSSRKSSKESSADEDGPPPPIAER